MLQIEILDPKRKAIGGIVAIIDFSSDNEVKTVIKSIMELHNSIKGKNERLEKEVEIAIETGKIQIDKDETL